MPTVPSEEFVKFGAALRRMVEEFAEQNRLLVLPNFGDKWHHFKFTMARSANLFVERNHLTREDGLMLLLSVVYYYGREVGKTREQILARIRHIYLTGNVELFPAGTAPLGIDVKHDALEILIAIAGHFGDQIGRSPSQLISLAADSFAVWAQQEDEHGAPDAPPIQGLVVDIPAGMKEPEIKVG